MPGIAVESMQTTCSGADYLFAARSRRDHNRNYEGIIEYEKIRSSFFHISFNQDCACACTLLNVGLQGRCGVASTMIPKRFFSSTTGLHLVLTIALSLSCWSYIRFERYGLEIRTSFRQVSEALSISAKARVSIVRVAGWIRLDSKTNDVERPYDREITSIINNIDRLQILEFLGPKEISLLRRTRELIKAHIMPIAVSGRGYDRALRYADEVEQNLARISEFAAVHRREVKGKEEFRRTFTRSLWVFVLSLVVLISGVMIITQNAEFEKRRNEYVRSVALLHAHMTRSRVAALRLFLDYFNDQRSPAPEMLRAALEAVKELEGISSGLVRIVNSERDAHTEALGELLQGIRVPLDTEIGLEIESNAKFLHVSAIQVHLVVEELVNNAVSAVVGTQTKQITIRARLLNRHFSFANKLLIQVADTGGGMTSDILDKAATPFFSTRAGSHVGLGLTSCIEMVKAMRGKVKIASTPGVGTVVSVLLPLNQR